MNGIKLLLYRKQLDIKIHWSICHDKRVYDRVWSFYRFYMNHCINWVTVSDIAW
ncbi:MAG: hypothetical protein ACYDG2_18365 [Ruminiclostridium sp.]